MEINHNNNIIPEFHVAQQRRRDKLRVQQFDELQQSNNFPHHHSYTFIPPPPPDMLSFAVSQSSTATPFPNIHPTRYVASSSSDSCDPQHQLQQQQLQQQQLQGYEAWVVPHYLVNHSSQTPETDGYHSNALSWGNGNNGGSGTGTGTGTGSELPLLPANFVSHQTDNVGTHPHDRGLSLSLSSNQICEYQHLNSNDPPEFKPFESGTISSVVKQSMSCSGKLACGSSQVQDVSFQVHRNVGPLGPFTGYASILKSSKFLKPAQQLLDEFFGVAGSWRRGDDDENDQSLAISRSHNMDDLSGRSCSESYRPDCHERKAKLLHMQEEVCKRHKQYHQQMEMVISAFDSVPGLSNATPYISRSIKTISRHFRCLKNAIADQLKHIKRALGEDFASPPGFLKGDSSSSLRYDQNFAKARSGAIGGAGHVGHQSHVWRPQRGLPERAVSILRAWLFDHFLHPYPTDNDKQMLATQTGLTRNQVSNWFINARVRLWKPMVEEIHTLETKASSRSDHNSNNSVMSIIEIQAAAANQSGCKASSLNPVCDKQSERLGSSSSLEQSRGETINTEQLFQKCSRIESHQLPTNVDGSFIRFLPYQRRGLELGGIGAVSLTLGLRHGSETTQQQLQHQFIPQGMPFGGHVIHDYSG